MFDGIKLQIKNNQTNTHLKNKLDFLAPYKISGEIINERDKTQNSRLKYIYAEHKNLNFKIYESETLILTGSIHYYANNGENNFNDFTIKNLEGAINDFSKEFNINPKTARLQNLEFGLNLDLPHPVKLFIDNVVAHKSNTFNARKTTNIYELNSIKKGGQYGIKIYDKGLQFSQPNNLLRFEIKCLKMQVISKETIYLADLLRPDLIKKCSQMLLKSFDELIIKEPVKGLNNNDEIFYLKYTNPNYQTEPKNKVTAHRERKRYINLIKKYSTDPIKDRTRKILVEKLNFVLPFGEPICNLFTENAKVNTGINKEPENSKMKPFYHLDKKLSKGYTSNSSNEVASNCKTCGRPLIGQKKGSVFCSEKIYGKEAKKCRNEVSNPKNNLLGKIDKIKSKGTLFDIEPYLVIGESLKTAIGIN